MIKVLLLKYILAINNQHIMHMTTVHVQISLFMFSPSVSV